METGDGILMACDGWQEENGTPGCEAVPESGLPASVCWQRLLRD